MTCTYCTQYKAIHPPRGNCQRCWDKYFTINHGIWLGTKMAVREVGRDKVVGKFGTKFVKQFERYTKESLQQ